jgi:hypothetical protein
MLDALGRAPVLEAGRHTRQQPDFLVHRAQQQRPAVGRHCCTIETGFHTS